MGVKYTITYGAQSKEITDANNNSFTLNYVGVKSESISAGSGKTLSCNGKVMRGNLNVGSHSMDCSGKIMRNDVIVTSQSYTPNVTITITGSGSTAKAYVTVNGVNYTSPATLSVPPNTMFTAHACGTKNILNWTEGRIFHNDEKIKNSIWEISQDFSATENITISMEYGSSRGTVYVNGGTRI